MPRLLRQPQASQRHAALDVRDYYPSRARFISAVTSSFLLAASGGALHRYSQDPVIRTSCHLIRQHIL
ncbi:hypothetical protein CLOP_g9985 [Closterium sp. NIES-67]|nr:hypothetical protein CLOP_g9985 [Closterium sp. NIES-67]